VVKSLASKTGLSKEAVYWIFVVINFVILAAGLSWVVRKVLPNGFAPRTAEIQKALEEARKASADASARLGEIEGRLAKLDAEIAEIRSTAEADFTVEEQRIKAAAEQDAQNVIAAAEQEIAAASRTAQRELKSFVADLAVNLAENKIKVDDRTDQALIRSFAAELGKDGQ
jgi:F-type H+-transporting ATPase subunit b